MIRMKTILLCALLAIAGSATAQTVKMTAEDVEINAGGTAEVTLNLETSMEIAGWQMYLYLPDGITVPFEEEDDERYFDESVVLSSRHKRSHVCTVTETADGGWLIQGYNPSKPTAITGTEGPIVTLTLKASNAYSGQHTATIKGVAVAEMDNTQTDMVGNMFFNIAESLSTGLNGMTIGQGDIFYNLGGKYVENPSKGIFVKKGKKEIKH